MPIFMKLSGITGNDQSVAGLPGSGWIEVNSIQWGLGRGISSPTGGSADREGSTPSVSEIVVTKATDSASSNLFLKCLAGARLTGSIVITHAGSGSVYHTISLTNATISSFTTYTPPLRKGKSTRHEKLTLTFSEYRFNGALNVPIPPTLVPPQGSQAIPINEGGSVRLQEIWTNFRLTPAQIR
jgi:type VI secretion system secreted protein Hcp